MDKLTFALLGFVLGIISRLVYDWWRDRREAKSIRKALLLEILYLHDSTMFLHLDNDKYIEGFQSGKFDEKELKESFWKPKYSTKVYDNMSDRIDRLLGSDLCLQIHYYYLLIQRINEFALNDDDTLTSDYAIGYLKQAAHTYAMGIGTVEGLLGKPQALSQMRENIKSMIQNFDDVNTKQRVAKLMYAYGQKGTALSLGLDPDSEEETHS